MNNIRAPDFKSSNKKIDQGFKTVMGFTLSFTKEDADRKWYLVDMRDKTLGRAASRIAYILRGKNKPTFTPHDDVGDFVIVINAKHLHLTGNKLLDKKYYRYTGHIGGQKETTAGKLLKKKPEELVYRAVKGMLPRGPLAYHQLKKLKIYPEADHPHSAQKPEVLDIK